MSDPNDLDPELRAAALERAAAKRAEADALRAQAAALDAGAAVIERTWGPVTLDQPTSKEEVA